MSSPIFDALNNFIDNLPGAKRIWIAYSGGVDSHVLLYALTEMRKNHTQLNLSAIHINHGLSNNADQWTHHCEQICHHLNIPCQTIHVNVNSIKGESLEALARNARYQAFAELLTPQDILLTAHHLNDQAETCFLQFLRGSGPKGLASMPAITQFAQGTLMRPFLSISRQEILDYAKNHQLQWVEDDSNRDTQFTRNFLRHHVIPTLNTRWPNISKTITRVSQHCLETNQLLQELAEQDLISVRGPTKDSLSIKKLQELSPVRQKNLIRLWLLQLGFQLPSTIKLQHILDNIVKARIDANPFMHWKGVEIRRYHNHIYAMEPLPSHDLTTKLIWNSEHPLELPANIGSLHCQKRIGQGIRIIEQPFTIQFRQGGERCHLKGRRETHTLKNLFQEWQIPVWERSRIPLVFIENQLAAIVGYGICQEFAAKEDEAGLVIMK